MNSRQSGLDWLDRMGRTTDELTKVTKYFTAEESRTHTPVWWFELAKRKAIDGEFLNVLCQVAPGSTDFRHLRIPMRFFLEHEQQIWFREDNLSFSPHLSTERSRLFRELRGSGQIEFASFEVK